ncbi:MAG: hypothetical protein JST64_00780 [Actinobacteria bacterium]|nr:hypothetical protein [Actinomycetota bacterium]
MNETTLDTAESSIVTSSADAAPRRTFELDDTGFKEVPKRWRKFYRHWQGAGDELAPNEVICPVCKVVIRSHREFRPGDRVYCMPCMSRLVVVERPDGRLEADVLY